jgi:hypothetical protein
MGFVIAAAACQSSAESSVEGTETDTTIAIAAADTPVRAIDSISVPPITPEEKKETKEVKHYSQDNRALDSIKEEKARQKRQPVREIKHHSPDDRLLDSIKQSKRKGKS